MTTPQRSTRIGAPSERARRPRRCDAVKRAMAVYSAASEAAAAVASCHHEMRLLTAAFANGDDQRRCQSIVLRSARHAVQSAQRCAGSDDGRISSVAVARKNKPADDSLLAAATACVPSWLRERPQSPLTLRNRPCKRANSHDLELHVDGAFTAIVEVEPHPPSWLPARVAIGPSGAPMPFGARQPAELLVFADLTARAGAVLVGLETLPPAERLRPLIVWISSLHNLFTAACHGCGEVFPPGVASAALLLPPTARSAALKPYHEEVYLERFGRPAEEAFLEEARRRM